MCLDEAMECLVETDKRVLISEQKKVPPVLNASAGLKVKHQAKAGAVLKQGGGKASGKHKKAMIKALIKDNFAAQFDISHELGKPFAPSGGSVWRAVTGRPTGCGHHPPMPRCSKPLVDGQSSCREALGDVCINLWAHHIVATRLEVADVPWDFACR